MDSELINLDQSIKQLTDSFQIFLEPPFSNQLPFQFNLRSLTIQSENIPGGLKMNDPAVMAGSSLV
jgi:hypothetical protein